MTPERWGRWDREAVLLTGFALVMLGLWLGGFRPFYLPNNDYFSFQRTAESLAAGELPASFKRMPLLPALMALTAPLLGRSAHPYLDAALAWNLAFALGLFGAVALIGRRLLGPGGGVLAVATATSVPFQSMARQPLVDPSLAFFVAAALLLHARSSRWAYALAALAFVSRLEAGVVLAVIFLARAWRRDGRGRAAELGLAALAAAPALAWVALGMRFGSDEGGYVAMMAGGGFTPAWPFPEVALRQSLAGLFDPLLPGPALAALAGPIAALGLVRLGRADRPTAVALVAVYVLSVAAIVAFGISKARYALPTLWIPTLVLMAGLPPFLERPWRRRPAWVDPVARALAVVATFLMLKHWFGVIQREPSQATPWADLGLFAAAYGAAASVLIRPLRPPAALFTVALVLVPLFGGGVALSRYELNKVRYHNYEAYALGDWARRELGPEDGLATLATSQVRFLAPNLPAGQVVSFQDLVPEGDDPAALRRAMVARGVSHVGYTYRDAPRDEDGAYYHRLFNVPLAERFAGGGPVPGFEHVATLPVPSALEHADVQVYRVAP